MSYTGSVGIHTLEDSHLAGADSFARNVRGAVAASPSLPVGIVFVIATLLGIGALAGQWGVAVYALSFWHYPIYALAFVLRAVRLAVFERDAVFMKGVSLAAFAAVYLTVTPNFLSLMVVAIGLLFNLSAARALGTDRTYYGYELAALPPRRVTAFPYSVLSHPMLTGNALAFAGTLLNAEFRADWWPLAVAHVILNLAILVMEARARPRQLVLPAAIAARPWLTAWPAGAGLVAAGALLAGLAGSGIVFVAGVALASLAYGLVLLTAYAWPNAAVERRRTDEQDGGHHGKR